MRGRQVFLDSLRLHGVSKIFGNPGTTESPLLDSLLDYPEIEYIMHLHEGVAVGAANFYAQASASTGVANMHVAPGLGNAIGMIYGALKNNSPMLVTAGQQDTRIRLRDPVLGHDLVAMAAPVTKWSVQVERADEMAAILQRAFKVANEAPAGPVFVALPIDVMEQETDSGATTAGPLATRHPVGGGALERLAELVASCESPVIVAGDEVARCNGVEALVALSEKLAAPVHLELLSGRVGFPTQHANFRGRLGPDHASIRRSLADYDLVLLVGGPFFEEVWFSPGSPFNDNTAIVQIEATASRLAHNFPVTLGVAGDLQDALIRLDELIGDPSSFGKRREALADGNRKQAEALEERRQALWDRSPMAPARALDEVGRRLPDDAVVVDESITAMQDVLQCFQFGEGQTYYAGRGGGIGQGVAGSLGAAVGHPDRPVVAITGDGSAMYSMQSLWTAAHHGLNILYVILSNREYRVLKHNVDQYRRRFDAPSNKPYPHMDLTEPNLGFVDIARGMGIPAREVSDPDNIAAAVATAMATNGPYLIDLVVEGLEFR